VSSSGQAVRMSRRLWLALLAVHGRRHLTFVAAVRYDSHTAPRIIGDDRAAADSSGRGRRLSHLHA
jgi:hypothetical protein